MIWGTSPVEFLQARHGEESGGMARSISSPTSPNFISIYSTQKVDYWSLNSNVSEAVAVEEFPSETKRALTPSGPEEKAEQSVSEYGTLSEAPMGDEPPLPHLSHKEHALLNSIVQLRHWLAETERDAGLTVDIIDVQAVRDSVNHMQVSLILSFKMLAF